jgi:hypothetical protein
MDFETARKAYPGTRRGFAPEWDAFRKRYGNRIGEIIPLLLPAIAKYRAQGEKKSRAENRPPMWQHFKTWIYQEGWTMEYPGEAAVSDETSRARALAHKREHGFWPSGTPNAWLTE